ncbi:DsbA family oxidoreductase [Shewanella sp. SR44-3]|uniref:DsbA family oxidoreductase n=1 Tax=unclassified Shewanella TaxID=196818 RepID=UPI0015FA6667|nr:DsbA family oxidoreductase [Shewanella sp. SR44-3]MBB1269192.1 DsbA family oxidoreductase [Shewanella sp. SR44-3]
MAAAAKLQIDIVSDIMCPWCIVGYKRLTQALSQYPQLDVSVNWHPFELNPNLAPEGQHLGEHLAQKYGSTPEQSQQNRQRLADLGKELHFEFNFQADSRIFNTFLAHQLLFWAGQSDKQTALKLALFDVYFTQQQNPNDIEVLVSAAVKVGLDADGARTILTDGRFAAQVKEAEQLWISRGIQAVPAIVFNQQYLLSGAQPVEVIEELITKVLG